jgi:hypothetical protein
VKWAARPPGGDPVHVVFIIDSATHTSHTQALGVLTMVQRGRTGLVAQAFLLVLVLSQASAFVHTVSRSIHDWCVPHATSKSHPRSSPKNRGQSSWAAIKFGPTAAVLREIPNLARPPNRPKQGGVGWPGCAHRHNLAAERGAATSPAKRGKGAAGSLHMLDKASTAGALFGDFSSMPIPFPRTVQQVPSSVSRCVQKELRNPLH